MEQATCRALGRVIESAGIHIFTSLIVIVVVFINTNTIIVVIVITIIVVIDRIRKIFIQLDNLYLRVSQCCHQQR